MASKRWWIRAVVVLGGVVIVLGGCGNRGDSGPPALTAEEVAAAEYTILAATQTMFTWYPTQDASPADGYQRTAPALRGDVRASFDLIANRAAAKWPDWRKQKATVTAASAIAGRTPDTSETHDTVERAVIMTQTVKAPDGRVLDESTFNIDRVVAKKGPDGWKVEAINFFPENQFFTPTCPPGTAKNPSPDGPCTTVASTKACPDGTTVPAGAVCAAPRNQPQTKQCPDGTTVLISATCANQGTQTKQCPDGSTVAAGAECATHGSRTKQCPDGSTVLDTEECGTAGTQPCPEGQTRAADGTCTSPVVTCPDGSTAPAAADCPRAVVTCPDGTTVPDGQTCKPVTCPDGQTVPNGQSCPPKTCPDGASVPNGSSCPSPCPGDQVRGGDGVCRCPAGTRAESGGACGPIVNVAPLAPGGAGMHTVSFSTRSTGGLVAIYAAPSVGERVTAGQSPAVSLAVPPFNRYANEIYGCVTKNHTVFAQSP